MVSARTCNWMTCVTGVLMVANVAVITSRTPLYTPLLFGLFPQMTAVAISLILLVSFLPSAVCYMSYGEMIGEDDLKKKLNLPDFMKVSVSEKCIKTELLRLMNMVSSFGLFMQFLVLFLVTFFGVDSGSSVMVIILILARGFDAIVSTDIYYSQRKYIYS